MKKTALVLGATGMVGTQLVNQLLQDSRFELVKVFVRKPLTLQHSKLEVHIVDFDHPEVWKKLITGNVLYSVMGTTLRQAGSKAAQYKVDYTYQYTVARYAAQNGVETYVLLSAAGSSPNAQIFYSKMKGELERDIKKLPFDTIHIMRPGMLTGKRPKTRTGEHLAATFLSLLSKIPGLHTLAPTTATEMAEAMVQVTFRQILGIQQYNVAAIRQHMLP